MFGKSLFIMPIHFLPKESVDFFRNDARTGSIFFTIPRTSWRISFFAPGWISALNVLC
jgi:hypothetical protein